MKSIPELVEFAEQTCVLAKDQPQYRPLPAHRAPDGTITFCWRLGWRDRLRVLWSGLLWHQVLTFNGPLQPQLLLTEKPELGQSNMGQQGACCRRCGCTDDDCSGCIARTGEPCFWVEEDLCSACAESDDLN